MSKIKVFVVDDSAVVRMVLKEILTKDSEIDFAGSASDPIFALKHFEKDGWPDLIVLDIEMPRMDGLTFLKKIMEEHPIPVIICSTLATKGAGATLEALSNGAFAVVSKPTMGLKNFLEGEGTQELYSLIKAAKRNKPMARRPISRAKPIEKAVDVESSKEEVPIRRHSLLDKSTDKFIALGSSTGGTQALEVVLTKLPASCKGIVIVQHMPANFTKPFADRLNGLCKIQVSEAKDGDRIMPGKALIAPGGHHLKVIRSGAQYIVKVVDAPPVNRHRPSVDVMFRSAAKAGGKNVTAAILTGMGGDGAKGLLELKDVGAMTYAQSEKTCVVFGMPKEAIKLDAQNEIVDLEDMASKLV